MKKIRRDLITALGIRLGFDPIFIERSYITGRYSGSETYFKAYHRSSFQNSWFVEKEVVEKFLEFPHARHKIFIFIGDGTTIEFIVLDFDKFLKEWDGTYRVWELPKTTYWNKLKVEKLVVEVPMKYFEDRGFFYLGVTGEVVEEKIDPSSGSIRLF